MRKFHLQNIKSKSPYIKNYSWRALQMISRQGVNILILIIAAKLLPAEEFGVYNYLIAFVFLFTLLADFGITRGITKFTAEYNVKDSEQVKTIFFNSGIILISLIFLFTIVLFLLKEFLIGEYHYYLVHLIPIFIFLPLTSLFDGIYIGLQKFRSVSIIYLVAGIIALLLSFYLIQQFKIIGAFYALGAYYIILFILLSINFKYYSFDYNAKLFKSLAKYSIILGLSGLGHFLYSRANVIILGKFDFFTEAGYYQLIDKIFVIFTFGVIIFGQTIAPRVTELTVEKRFKKLASYFLKISTSVFLIGCLVSIITYFIFPAIMQIFLEEYLTENFILMFSIMLINLPFLIVSNCISHPFVIGTGLAKYSLLTIPFGLLNVGLSILFVSYFGFIGVVYSLIIVSISNKVTSYSLVYRKLKKNV